MAFYTSMISAGLILSIMPFGFVEKSPDQAAFNSLSHESSYENFQFLQNDADLLTELMPKLDQPNPVAHRGSGRTCPLAEECE